MTELSDSFKRELRRIAHATQDSAREQYEGDAKTLSQINEMAEMLYELQVESFEGYLKPLLAWVYHEALTDVQSAISTGDGNIGPNTVFSVTNPYAS